MLEELKPRRAPATEAVRAGDIAERSSGRPVAQPIYQTTVYAFDSIEEMDKVLDNPDDGWFYYRYASPNQVAFDTTMARLERAEAATTAASGMGAIFSALSAVLQNGDHIIADENIYGGTYSLLQQQMPRFGIETSFVDTTNPDAVRAAMRPTSRVLYFETISNPLLRVADLPALSKLAAELNLRSFVDATFSTPIISRPAEWGVDVILHATTKYVGGHSDALGGIVAGRLDIIEATRLAGKIMGVTQSPFDAWLNVRSLKTLPLRMKAHSQNAQTVAEWLEGQTAVARVMYPGLASNPQRELALRMMPEGLFGGMLSFELTGGRTAAYNFIRALQHIPLVPSLADVATTVSHPASTSHRMLTPEQRAAIGIGDGLVRLSVGIEEVGDIIEDLAQALRQA